MEANTTCQPVGDGTIHVDAASHIKVEHKKQPDIKHMHSPGWETLGMKRFDLVMNPYKILGLPQNANTETINRAYKAAALAAHSDKNGDAAGGADSFHRIVEAKRILLDPDRRQATDQAILRRNMLFKSVAVFEHSPQIFSLSSHKITYPLITYLIC